YKDFKGYRIVVFLDIALGISAPQHDFDFGQQLHGSLAYWGKTVADVREMIEQRKPATAASNRQRLFLDALGTILSGFPGLSPNDVVFLAGLHDINLVYFDTKILAIPKVIGPVNLPDPQSRHDNRIRQVSTRLELRQILAHQFALEGLDW